jgi:hypothetical protein
MRHPFYDMDEKRALALAARLVLENALLPSLADRIPSIPEAINLLHHERGTCGFNWITGRVAEEVLRAVNGETNTFTT